MSITITDEQIKQISEEIQKELINDDTGEQYPIEQVIPMVENWVHRTIYEISRSPWWHACRSQQNAQTMASFETDFECAYFGWSQCHNKPQPGSAFCEEHQEEKTEALAPVEN